MNCRFCEDAMTHPATIRQGVSLLDYTSGIGSQGSLIRRDLAQIISYQRECATWLREHRVDRMAWLGLSDAVLEECLILMEERP